MTPADELWTCSEANLAACTATPWGGEPGLCRWCLKPLTGRRRRWCSDECSNNMARNHYWTFASRARSRLDGHKCVECGTSPREAWETAIHEGRHLNARRYLTLQVHHRVPILGRHSQSGCHHHIDGLVTLCLFHHVQAHHGERPEQLGLVT